ncbi:MULTISPECIES: helix-turn-helix domain-containing protein [Brevibacterium]|uniref:HTH araC/xylS-type domain-containing protein n=1 Tax=Brevibacterium salitolerans TaxID=1403566 RepID=A0ABP5IF95_9MICO|nr:helix-turn-helix domain-containing protein [Brevibacterium sp.]
MTLAGGERTAEAACGLGVLTDGVHRQRGRAGLLCRSIRFGEISLMGARGTAVELVGRPEAQQAEMFELAFLGNGLISHDGFREGTPVPARLLLVPPEASGSVRLLGSWELLVVGLPWEAMESFVPNLPRRPDLFTDTALLEDSMHAFAHEVLAAEKPATAIESYAVGQLLVEMGGAVLLNRLGGFRSAGSPQAVLRDRAMAIIAQQCTDVELTPALVAEEVQSSLRQVQAVFAEAGTTVAGEIRRQRARTARGLLIDSRFDVLSVEAIAERSGFGTTMSMRRALKDHYGTSPRELRKNR